MKLLILSSAIAANYCQDVKSQISDYMQQHNRLTFSVLQMDGEHAIQALHCIDFRLIVFCKIKNVQIFSITDYFWQLARRDIFFLSPLTLI